MAHALDPHGPGPHGPVPPVPVPHRQFIVRLNRREYVLLREALTDGFIIVWLGDSHARNVSQRNRRRPGNFPIPPTIRFVGQGGRNIASFVRNHYQQAIDVLPTNTLQRIGILWLGSNDIDVGSWPRGTPMNKAANELLSLRDSLLNHYDYVFIVGFPERDFCRQNNPDLVHRLSMKCNQRLNNAIKGWYIMLPRWAFSWTDDSRFCPDGVHFCNALYNFILHYVQQKIRAIMIGDPEYVIID
ncbi:unnamed protein product [Meganyctiphanes norvegica]|uniref:SGNH hydrolase-type esterase domain-containing protein n=1 Tax=Meganyctiphanes norvegica TaxID=48144 RepID=A0AAV2SMV9_MEGNR